MAQTVRHGQMAFTAAWRFLGFGERAVRLPEMTPDLTICRPN